MKNLKKMVVFIVLLLCFTAVIPSLTVNNITRVEAASTKLNTKKVTLYCGQSYNLSLKNASKKVSWSSGDKAIATVNKSGKVITKSDGVVTITAKSNGKSYKCKVTVKTLDLYKTNAKTIVNALQKYNLKIENITNYNKKNDSNGLLGKYGQYKSKTDFYDSRYLDAGDDDYCTVEVFENDEFAIDRYNYIDSIYKAFPNWRMRMYQVDNVVIRLTPSMSKSEANNYYKAIKKMSGN